MEIPEEEEEEEEENEVLGIEEEWRSARSRAVAPVVARMDGGDREKKKVEFLLTSFY